MKRIRHTAYWSFWVAFAVMLFAPQTAMATVTVDSLELIDRTRVGRTTYNYTYQITVTNTAPVDLNEVIVYLSQVVEDPQPDQGQENANSKLPAGGGVYTPVDLTGTSNPTGTSLIDDVVDIGTMAAGETIVSDDVIILQQDRLFQLDTTSLFWEVGYAATVTLTGLVTDQPISNAEVSVTVDRIDSGRPIIESGRPIIEQFSTTADEEGRYAVDVDFYTTDDFVSLSGDGVGNLDFVTLVSIAGSAGSLLTEATTIGGATANRSTSTIVIDGADANALNVTHVSTALAVLATDINGGQGFTNDEDLAAAQAQVNNDELLISAAVLKTVIDTSDIGLPDGVETTLDLLNNEEEFDEFLEFLENDFPEELQDAIEETIEDINVGYVAEELPPTLYLAIVRENPLISGSHVFTFDQNGTGTHIDGSGETTDADWIVNAAGEIIVTLNNPPQVESFPFLEVPPGSGIFEQVQQVSFTSAFRIARIAVGVETDQVLLGSTFVQTYPNEPTLPTVTTISDPAPQNARLAFDETGIEPYTTSELAGQVREMEYFHIDNNSVGLNNTSRGADLLTFNADGSGSTERRSFAFNWSIDNTGVLTIEFGNGDSNVYARYTQIDQGIVDQGVLVGRYGTEVSAIDSLGVRPFGISVFTEADLLDRKFRNGRSVVEGNAPGTGGFGSRFDMNFLPDDVGCRDDGFFLVPFDWQITAAGYMQYQRFSGEPPELTRQRSWRPVAIVPGVLGPRYWVIENLDISFISPGFPTDPTLTPGRVNFYEYIKDIGDNTPPVAVADSASTTQDTSVVIDIFSNDTDAEGDDILIVSWSATALGGTIDIVVDPETGNSYSSLVYTPPPGVTGVTDTFTYSISDSSCAYGPPDEGVVSITIGAPSAAP